MQEQAPGYKPTKKRTGMKKGKQISATKGKKRQQRKTSAYSKNRSGVKPGVKTTRMGSSKGIMMNQPMKRMPVQSNNMPGFNAPIGPPSILL